MTDLRKTAVYIRLSAEDDNVDGRAKKESDSVTSQRILLKSFVIDELGVVESDILEYVDDGVSGKTFPDLEETIWKLDFILNIFFHFYRFDLFRLMTAMTVQQVAE